MVTSKERAVLRAFSNDLKDLLYIGKEGITEGVLTQVKDNLRAHELIKIKVQKSSEFTPIEIAKDLETNLDCETVAVIGNKIVLYKYSSKENFKHFLERNSIAEKELTDKQKRNIKLKERGTKQYKAKISNELRDKKKTTIRNIQAKK